MLAAPRLLRTCLAVMLFALAGAASAQPASPSARGGGDPSEAVWCHDQERAIVRRMARWRCEHDVVSAEEARRVQQDRVRRIQRVLKRDAEPVVPGRRLRGTGTGFYVSEQGHVLTNHHVVETCAAVTVTPAGGSEHLAELLRGDKGRDLALLTSGRASPGVALFRDFDEVIPSESVTVVGYPLHGKVVIKPIVVSGNVYDGAPIRNPNIFAMNIDIRRGNSGGPILDDAARVIGVVFAKVDTPAVYAETGKLIRDVGLGIRLPIVRDFLRPLAVDARTTGDGTRLEYEARSSRAREFIAQIGCWR